MTVDDDRDFSEWLETDGLGGFASGTVCGQRTRRYHALLLVAQKPPAERVVLVNGIDVVVETPDGEYPISTQYYRGDVRSPDGGKRLESFSIDPWPTWRFEISEAVTIVQELFVPEGLPGVAMRWRVEGPRRGLALRVRPFLSGRDFHTLHHANPDFDSATYRAAGSLSWQPYLDLPSIHAQANARFVEAPDWYHGFLYTAERERGLDDLEDLATPGEFHWDLNPQDAYLLLSANQPMSKLSENEGLSAENCYAAIAQQERHRREQAGREAETVRSYIVKRGAGASVIAGYPWFGDWGRDTFIALRGLCLTSPDRLDIAHRILLLWSETVSQGMLPNRFPDRGDTPEYNAVDASLWYIVAVQESFDAHRRESRGLPHEETTRMLAAVNAILDGYTAGTRYGIRMEDDGLIAAGESGVQLAWMDAKVGDWVVTPRIGKPVEIQALWINALAFASRYDRDRRAQLEIAQASFVEKFWNEADGYLHDIVDHNHVAGSVDAAFRPNQIFAAGGLPIALLDEEKCRRVVEAVEARLLTPIGLRSLAPGHPDYKPRYQGDLRARDAAYHQGTVWPWLMGPFVEAWLKVHGGSAAAKSQAKQRFLQPLQEHLQQAGQGHISEVADAEPPHTPRGCPFQAWSYGEYLRIQAMVR
ncbi:amylo-alpha-1,6-glucosidase [Rosistilla oblonga]|uniref:amylo-alpha-1,6-glucosidase n=1 Tax=Rosistilla oblonga TaxID=2527990 RepID=UPI003A969BF3